jgi:hypothetical protein
MVQKQWVQRCFVGFARWAVQWSAVVALALAVVLAPGCGSGGSPSNASSTASNIVAEYYPVWYSGNLKIKADGAYDWDLPGWGLRSTGRWSLDGTTLALGQIVGQIDAGVIWFPLGLAVCPVWVRRGTPEPSMQEAAGVYSLVSGPGMEVVMPGGRRQKQGGTLQLRSDGTYSKQRDDVDSPGGETREDGRWSLSGFNLEGDLGYGYGIYARGLVAIGLELWKKNG